MSQRNDNISINVGGVVFRSTIVNLLKFAPIRRMLISKGDDYDFFRCTSVALGVVGTLPIEKIEKLAKKVDSREVGDVFFDKSPVIFEQLLMYARYDNIFVIERPNNVVMNELNFWRYPWTCSNNSTSVAYELKGQICIVDEKRFQNDKEINKGYRVDQLYIKISRVGI